MTLHPAENRGYRELFAYSRQLVVHWEALAARIGSEAQAALLRKGAAEARKLMEEVHPLMKAEDLHAGPAAQGLGASVGRGRGTLRDRFLERNQALRFSLEELQHVTTLLGYLAAVSERSGNAELAAVTGRWEKRLRRLENEIRRAIADLAVDRDGAVAPLDDGAGGKAAHKVQYAVGALGEWADRRSARRR